MDIIQKTREVIDELQGLDFKAMSTKELKERRAGLRKCIEELTIEMFDAKKRKDSIRSANLKEARREAMALNEKMETKFVRGYQKLNKIITIVGVIALVVVIAVVASKMMGEGNFENTRAMKASLIQGVPIGSIFEEIDADAEWFAGQVESGQEVVQVELDLPLDLNQDGITQLEKTKIQWILLEDSWEFYTLAINDSPQTKLEGMMLYTEIIQAGIQRAKEQVAQGDAEDQSSQDNIATDLVNVEEMVDEFPYVNYSFSDVINEFGDDYEVVDYEGGLFVMYEDQGVPYAFGFMTLEPQSKVVTIFIHQGAEFMGISIGMPIAEVVEILGEPDSAYKTEEGNNEYYTEYVRDGYTLELMSADENSEIKGAAIRNITSSGSSTETSVKSEKQAVFVIDDNFVLEPSTFPALRPYNDGGKTGYVDQSGNVVIEPIYDQGWDFSGDTAIVSGQSGSGFIDKQGNPVVELMYDELWKCDDQLYIAVKGNLEYLIMEDGNEFYEAEQGFLTGIRKFTNGYAVSYNGSKYGVVNKQWEPVLDYEYDSIYHLENGLLAVRYLVKDKYGLNDISQYKWMNMTGETVAGPFEFVTKIYDGLARYRNGEYYGFLNEAGDVSIQPQYKDAGNFSEGLAAVDTDGDGRYGYIDLLGNLVIEEKYYAYGDFSEGRAVIKIGGIPGVIDTAGNLIYFGGDYGVSNIESFSNGMAVVSKKDMYDSYCGYIDRDGVQVIPFDFDYANSFYNGIAEVHIDENVFSINLDGFRVGQ